VHDVLQLADAAGEAINARDHQHVTLAQEVEDSVQFLPPHRAPAAVLLSTDHFTPSGFQRGPLDGQVLIDRADARTR
jgi:hypothetical protein